VSKSFLKLSSFKDGVAVYHGRHSTGPPKGTSLEFEIRLKRIHDNEWGATIHLEGCVNGEVISTLMRLRDWLKRIVEALEEDGWKQGETLPLGRGAKL